MSVELGGTKWTTWDDVEKEMFTPEEIAEVPESYTGYYVKKYLKK